MTDMETKLRDGLDAYATETATRLSPPALASISTAASAGAAGTGPRRLPRWAKVAFAVAGGVVVTTGMATAFGVMPAPVAAMLREFRSWGFDVSGDEARRMASASSGDTTYEVWLASGAEDQCVYVRVVRNGDDVDDGGGSACAYDSPWPASAFMLFQSFERIWPGPDRLGRVPTIAGRLPAGATQVEVEFSNGTIHRAAGEEEGYFVTVLPPAVPVDTRILSLRALGADGRIIDVITVSRPADARPQMSSTSSSSGTS